LSKAALNLSASASKMVYSSRENGSRVVTYRRKQLCSTGNIVF
jgi:hypothetical protein